MKLRDLSGQKFGRLLVLNQHESRKKKTFWKCLCDCGNETYVYSWYLTSGVTKSCGCLNREKASEHAKEMNAARIQDLTNQKFGKLTPLYIVDNSDYQRKRGALWHCLCDCGNTKDVFSEYLKSGDVQSCGCMKSKGENKISFLLQSQNIIFEREKTFEDCKMEYSHQNLRFDFYVDNKYLIEYDGEQHFKCSGKGWNTQEHLEATQQRDAFKNQYCKDHNIPLIRIPYTRYDDLCLEDLLLETSKFIVEQ